MNGMRDVSPAEGSRERTIRVAVGVGYDVVIGCGLLPDVGPRLASLWRTRRVAVFTDSNVAALYLPVLETSLRAAGFSVISQVSRREKAPKTSAFWPIFWSFWLKTD